MQLFREAGKAVYSMPVLLLQPIYVSIPRFNYMNPVHFISSWSRERRNSLFSDIFTDWVYGSSVDLLYVMDRECR